MSDRRMFSKSIVDSDAFLDMPLPSQVLYFHLSMRADDEGFINNVKNIMRMVGCNDEDLKVLVDKKFVIAFDSGIIAIKHWKIHNYIRGDRLTPTKYKDERDSLSIDDNGSYTQSHSVSTDSDLTDKCQAIDGQVTVNCPSSDCQVTDKCQADDGQMSAQVRLGKDRLGKDSINTKSHSDVFDEFCGEDEELRSALNDFEDMRKRMRKPMTVKAKELLIKDLKAMDRSQWIPCLNQSIKNSWLSVYPIKGGKAKAERSFNLEAAKAIMEGGP